MAKCEGFEAVISEYVKGPVWASQLTNRCAQKLSKCWPDQQTFENHFQSYSSEQSEDDWWSSYCKDIDIECLLNEGFTQRFTACRGVENANFITTLLYMKPIMCQGTHQDYVDYIECLLDQMYSKEAQVVCQQFCWTTKMQEILCRLAWNLYNNITMAIT